MFKVSKKKNKKNYDNVPNIFKVNNKVTRRTTGAYC